MTIYKRQKKLCSVDQRDSNIYMILFLQVTKITTMVGDVWGFCFWSHLYTAYMFESWKRGRWNLKRFKYGQAAFFFDDFPICVGVA
mmetsp:Transcript_6063/g.9222  ORF Transcript_6063/g.9222 Transcript_6063/m.9222 type:complete len:86 (-) Transcript_6063:121-378(-)